jgi:hypothetical protein
MSADVHAFLCLKLIGDAVRHRLGGIKPLAVDVVQGDLQLFEVAESEQVRDQILGKDHASRAEEDDPGHGPILGSASPVLASKR